MPEPLCLAVEMSTLLALPRGTMSYYFKADAHLSTTLLCWRLICSGRMQSVRLAESHVQEKAQICQLADAERRAFWTHRNACELLCQAAAEAEQQGVFCFLMFTACRGKLHRGEP